jgi:hypothetical protein
MPATGHLDMPATGQFQHPTDELAESKKPFVPSSSSFVLDFAFSFSLPAQPRLSGFLRMKKSRSCSVSLLAGWKERWFVLIPGPSYIAVHYYRSKVEFLSTSVKRVCVAGEEHAIQEPQLGGHGYHCFSFVSTSGDRVILAATSEFQKNLWISCINSMLDEGALPS